MDQITALAIITLAALLQSSFQLSVSMVTLLSSHSIGSKHSGRRTSNLIVSFWLGVVVMTTLIVSFLAFMATVGFRGFVPAAAWGVVCGLMIGLGLAVWAFYYRRKSGTSLWIPRGMARFLSGRTKATKSMVESFSLGLTSVMSELLFSIAPAAAAALALTYLPNRWQIGGLLLYVIVATLSITIVTMLVGSGHKISTIQRWREQNKRFLQFIAGSGFLVLGAFIYANIVAVAAISDGVVR